MSFALAFLSSVSLAWADSQERVWAKGPRLTTDNEFLLLADEVPGFGGLFYDRDGRATVYLTEVSQAGRLGSLSRGVRVVQGQYDFRQLSAWRNSLRGLLSRPDVVLLDVDETRNRVRLGVDRNALSALQEVESQLAGLGVPREAVVIEAVPAIHNLATLQDRVRPVPGGVQIEWNGMVCTLGFSAIRAAVGGFVTNSHCTGIQGGVQNTTFYQNTNSSINLLGTEIADPDYFTGSECPAGRRCRYSDSAFARYSSFSSSDFSHIARTEAVGSITISTSSPTFTIISVGKNSNIYVGQTLNKVGRTTGWTRGTVSSTCVDVNVSNSDITQLCQYFVNAGAGKGDSGSPVFSGISTGTLWGILWGGDSTGTQFIFSSWENIVFELGSMRVF